jgi:hypothetical protein
MAIGLVRPRGVRSDGADHVGIAITYHEASAASLSERFAVSRKLIDPTRVRPIDSVICASLSAPFPLIVSQDPALRDRRTSLTSPIISRMQITT